MSMRLDQLAERIGAKLVGDAALEVCQCAAIDKAQPDQVAFLVNRKYLRYLKSTRAGAVILAADIHCPDSMNRLISDDPYFAFREAVIALHGERNHPQPMHSGDSQISDQATVHPESRIGRSTAIHPNVLIERGATVGDGCVLYPGAYVGEHAAIGDECVLYSNVVIYDRCVLGNRVTLHANTVIGQDGFGYATHEGTHHKIPQTGIVVIEDDVELGASCAIERGAIGETRIGAGTKFADLISIGHGTRIGKHCLFVSLVGVSGSVEIGDYVALGGQVGVAGHLKIGDRVQVAGKSAITSDIPPDTKVGGVPAVDLETAKRNALVGRNLHSLAKRVRELERKLKRGEES